MRILSFLYGLYVWIRNVLYDQNILHSFRVPVATICVGNLAVGGTGKTPHVEYVVELLRENGYKVAVLSRGYKRKSAGFVLADVNTKADKIGDEPAQLKRKYPDLVVAVCEDRVRGIRKLLRLHNDLQCVLLDDAFQHRRLNSGYRIVLTQADRLFTEDHLLPWGRLREPAKSSLRADVVVVSKCPENMRPIDKRVIDSRLHLPAFQPLMFSRMVYGNLQPVFADVVKEVPDSRYALLLTGIAQPQYLQKHLEQSGRYDKVCSLAFRDHHRFTARDMAQMETLCEKEYCGIIITTEKDAVRLRDCAFFPEKMKNKIFYLPIRVDMMEDKETFNQNIIRYVKESNRNR